MEYFGVMIHNQPTTFCDDDDVQILFYISKKTTIFFEK